MASLRDVAHLAGVSPTTVSHALNGSRRIHPDTLRRIQQAVEALNYRPNMLARSLRQKQTRTIGLLISDIELPYFTEIARAVETTAYERGYSVVLCNTDESLEKEELYAEVLFGKCVDGLIIAPTPGDHAYLRPYLATGAKVVFINRYVPGIAAPAVVCDDAESTRFLTARLIGDGHRRLGAVIGLPDVTTTQQRLAGFRGALAQAGLDPDAAWIFPGGAKHAGGLEAARALAAMAEPPTALVAFNTSMIDGILLGLLEVAPQLVGRVEVTGFGCSAIARVCRASRYALDAPTREIGRVATTLLLDGLRDEGSWSTENIVLRAPLVDTEVKEIDRNMAQVSSGLLAV